MTTLIFIKKRSEPIKVSFERGAKVKHLWLDEQTPRDTVIDLGEWAGELREIKAVESEKEAPISTRNMLKEMEEEEEKIREEREEFKKLTSEEKIKKLESILTGSFSVQWKFRNNWESPTEDKVEDFKREAFFFFEANPEAITISPEEMKVIVNKLIN